MKSLVVQRRCTLLYAAKPEAKCILYEPNHSSKWSDEAVRYRSFKISRMVSQYVFRLLVDIRLLDDKIAGVAHSLVVHISSQEREDD